MVPEVQLCDVSMVYPVAVRRFWTRNRQARSGTVGLDGVNLRLFKRQHLALLGQNGAGKTTLLKVIAGMLLPTRGRVLVRGREVRDGGLPSRPRIGHALGDDRSFYWRLSGTENLRFFAGLHNLFAGAALARIETLLKAVGLEHSAHRRVAEYSTGMRQRLALARGLLTDPEVLLLDEPTRSLDPAATEGIVSLLAGVAQDRTLVLATNRLEDVLALCGTIAAVRSGRIVACEEFERGLGRQQLNRFVQCHLVDTSHEPGG